MWAAKAVAKCCRKVIITSRNLIRFILAGRCGALDPYLHAWHFSEYVPEYLHLSEGNNAALQASGVGHFTPRGRSSGHKIFQTFKEPRGFAAHLFCMLTSSIGICCPSINMTTKPIIKYGIHQLEINQFGFRPPLKIQTPSRYCVAQEILALTYKTYAAH